MLTTKLHNVSFKQSEYFVKKNLKSGYHYQLGCNVPIAHQNVYQYGIQTLD